MSARATARNRLTMVNIVQAVFRAEVSGTLNRHAEISVYFLRSRTPS